IIAEPKYHDRQLLVSDEEQNQDTGTPPDTIDTSSQTASRQDPTPAVLKGHRPSARPLHSDDRLTPTVHGP
ncbi:hypothetical protein E4U43_006746, partial [Claviceps pusilla]